MDGVKVLSSTDIADLRRSLDVDGYVVLRGVLWIERAVEFNEIILAEYDRAEKFSGGSYRGHLNCVPGEKSRFFFDEIVDSGLVDGAIEVLPNTHRQFYKFWQYALQCKYRFSARLPLHLGEVLVRRSTLCHRVVLNRSTMPRAMTSVAFGEISTPDGDPLVHDGKTFFDRNWFSTSRGGRLRERVFVKAPLSYSAYRFVTSLRGSKEYSSSW